MLLPLKEDDNLSNLRKDVEGAVCRAVHGVVENVTELVLTADEDEDC